MDMDITIFYSIILTTFMLILAFRVIDLRKSPVTKFLHSDDRVVDATEDEIGAEHHHSIRDEEQIDD